MNNDEDADILCLALLLVCLAFALCFAGYCRQRDQIANYKVMLLALPLDARTQDGNRPLTR